MTKKDTDYFDNLLQQQKVKTAERDSVAQRISDINAKSELIRSIPSLAKHLKEKHNIEKKPWELASILKDDLGMRYRKIKPLSMNTNSERNLVLRQQFALELIRLLTAGKRIINVD